MINLFFETLRSRELEILGFKDLLSSFKVCFDYKENSAWQSIDKDTSKV
jgi:hypothetical protein